MEIVILLYKGFNAMDVAGTYEILCRLPEAKVRLAAKKQGVIESEYPNMKMVATHSLAEVEGADVLLVPGSTFAFLQVAQDNEILQHIRRIDATTRWTSSVCSGAFILGAAGLLDGKKATTHWAILDKLKLFGAQTKSERYVHDGKLITAAGASAGIDMALYLASRIEGVEYAKMLQLVIEYYPQPPVDIPDLSAIPKNLEAEASAYLRTELEQMSRQMAFLN